LAPWPALRQAWAALDRPATDNSRQLAGLEREISTAQRRLADAAALLVDGTLDRLGYEVLRDRETAKITAAERERARLHQSSRQPESSRLPDLAHVLEQAGTWGRILREVDVAHQRAILNELVSHVVVRRVGLAASHLDFWLTAPKLVDLCANRATPPAKRRFHASVVPLRGHRKLNSELR
jgi:hypothetical protein